MKNQFFGDRRDFFKYDLLLEMLENLEFIRQLTFIPLLTPDDSASGGEQTKYECGGRRPEVYHFLKKCLTSQKRDIRELRGFLNASPFRYNAYRDSSYFTDENRSEYFRNISDSMLQEALVFLDPDNGLEVASMNDQNGQKYVRYDELRTVFNRMDDSSLIVVFQYLPRQNRERFFQRLASELHRNVEPRGLFGISDNVILYLVMTKDPERARLTGDLLRRYSQRLSLTLLLF